MALAAGPGHSMAVRADGTMVAWGRNGYGQATVPPGLSNVVAVAGGYDHSLALKSDGTVAVWGRQDCCGLLTPPLGLSNVVAVSAAGFHNLALRRDGTVVTWGSGSASETNVPPNLANVVAIAAGSAHSLALKSDGTVIAWGNNDYRQSNIPLGLSAVVAIAAGAGHSLALVGEGQPPPPLGALPDLLEPVLTGNRFEAQLPTFGGRVYALEFANSLSGANWVSLPMVLGDGTMKTVTDPAATAPHRFYRVRQWR